LAVGVEDLKDKDYTLRKRNEAIPDFHKKRVAPYLERPAHAGYTDMDAGNPDFALWICAYQ
jgi:hypothetical protein